MPQSDTTSITGDFGGGFPDGVTISQAILATALATPGAIKTGTTGLDTVLLQAYDVDGTTYRTFATLTAGNTPTCVISSPSGGTTTIENTVIGGSTPAAATFTTATATTANAANVGITDTLKLDTVSQMLTATVTLAAGATNSIDATITIKDMAAATVTGIHMVEVYLSTSSTGALVSATSYSGALTASTGAIIGVIAATKHIKAVTDTNGVLVLNLVASGKPATEYFCVVRPFGSLVVSAASGTSWGA